MFYTSTNHFLRLKNIFISSFKDDIETIHIPAEYPPTQDIGGGIHGFMARYNLLNIAFSDVAKDDYFIMSDVDIYFYKSILPSIRQAIQSKYDICFQKEFINTQFNIGFVLIKNTKNVQNFWTNVYNIIIYSKSKLLEQDLVNALLNTQKINFGSFDSTIWNMSLGLKYLSKDIVLHHANCVSSIEGKLKQFDDIKNIVQSL
jgi:hypothetical protein